MRRASHLLYEEVCDRIDYPKFLKHFHKENTFYSWFLVTEIHVWMLMVRAMRDTEHGKFIRNHIVEAMWKDVELRSKILGECNRRRVREQINELAGQFEYTLIAYDEGLTSNDRQLASAIWKQFFDGNCDDYVQIELMVKYIRANVSIDNESSECVRILMFIFILQVAMLDKLSSEEFLHRRKIPWTNLTES